MTNWKTELLKLVHRVMKINFLSFLLIGILAFSTDLFGSDHEEAQFIVIQQRRWQTPHPGLDMGFSYAPTYPHPNFFQLTLPKGQILWVLGTWHSIPLEALLPRRITHDLIERSAFLLSETMGECLSGEKCDYDQAAEWCFMHPHRIEVLIERYQNQYGALNKSAATIKEEFCLRDEDLATWYSKRDISEFCKRLRTRIGARSDQFLFPFHPLYLRHFILDSENMPIPPDSGVDHALCKLVRYAQKTLFSLEVDQDQYRENGELSLREQVETANLFNIDAEQRSILDMPTRNISKLLKNGYSGCFTEEYKEYEAYREKTKYYNIYTHPTPSLLFNKTILSLIRRNELWAQRLQDSIFSSTFNESFMFVGDAHLPDLSKRLEALECRIVRFSLGEYQEFTHTLTRREEAEFSKLIRWWNPRKFP